MSPCPVHIVSLGCPKNLVDAEVMAASLADQGYRLTEHPEEAEAIVVHTCAFILPAKEESIDEILRMAAWKGEAHSPCRHLVVTGCLAQRYGKELAASLPEVDLFLGLSEAPRLALHLTRLREAAGRPVPRSVVGKPNFLMNAGHRRLLSGPPHSAYLKIADGCSNHCAYCAIPTIRGEARSRPIDDVVAEAEVLAAQGVRELIVTAQDTTAYGSDLKVGTNLAQLLKALCAVQGLAWIRLLYAYPAHLTAELCRTIRDEEKLCHYLDLPVQHADDAVLAAMHRRGDAALIRDRIARAREICPDIALRTSLIVGFPGETQRRFEALLAFVREIRFDHLGVFTYSREEGTPAAALPSRITQGEKERRRALVMEEQAEISREINAGLIGTKQDCLVEGTSEAEGYAAVGRCRRQAPEIDGVTHLRGRDLEPGRIVACRIIAADEYDLYAEAL